MSDYARGGDNFDNDYTPTCKFEGCEKDVYTSKAGNQMATCKDHLNGLFETEVPKEQKKNAILKKLTDIENQLRLLRRVVEEVK